jgi:hypothetical protein
LRSLKCLQNKTLDYLLIPANIQSVFRENVVLNVWNCEYFFNICAKSVDISGNRISDILDDPWKKAFGQCVEMLDISHNNILQIDAGIVLHLLNFYPRLRVLRASSNNRRTSVTSPYILLSSFTDTNMTIRLSHQLEVFDFSNNYVHDKISNIEFTLIGSP